MSCSESTKQNDDIKIAKTVPLDYFNAGDTLFSNHQDTLYYGNNFFTGYRFNLNNDGDTLAVEPFFNGLEEGLHRKWYPDGQLAEARNYINGKKEGLQQGWWPDGKKRFSFTAANDEYEGVFREWYSSGLPGKEFHYKNGHEEGSQRLWWDNGTVRANYVIKNGKKYGLLGLKTCVNPYDSVFKK
jgi:antitoxin component YwqK of YwqJK toxin-antitoxin module